jgi:hypothetical protein
MNRTSLILTALMMISLTIFLAPGVLAMNRGKILQNIALWLAIFLGCAMIYKNFGPGSPHPLFGAAADIQSEEKEPAPQPAKTDSKDSSGI